MWLVKKWKQCGWSIKEGTYGWLLTEKIWLVNDESDIIG
jgi:hypothetical protein